MNKLTISNLILLILNDENTSILRNEALKELKYRSTSYGINYEDLIKNDEENINKRGFETKNYLFSKNVDIQQVMDSYFENYYLDNKLLLSEKELCNNYGEFFDTVCEKELINIYKRLKNNNLSINEKQRLIKIKELIEKRKNMLRCKLTSTDDIYEFLDRLTFDFDCDELLKNKSINNIELMKRALLGSYIENFFVRNLHISKIIRTESRKLKLQKKNILAQVKSGYQVNYLTPIINKALTLRKY